MAALGQLPTHSYAAQYEHKKNLSKVIKIVSVLIISISNSSVTAQQMSEMPIHANVVTQGTLLVSHSSFQPMVMRVGFYLFSHILLSSERMP